MNTITYHNAITDIWKFMKFYLEHGDPDDPKYWDGMVVAISEINEKYRSEFVKSMVFACANEIERVRRRAKA